MSAGPHLLQRLRRWWHIRLLATREAQQTALQLQMEQDIDERLAALTGLRRALRDTRARLATARHLAPPSPRPFTWGL